MVKIVDGDTVYVLDASQEQHKIRLSGIDTPERKQPFGTKAKERLSGLIAGENVRVKWEQIGDEFGISIQGVQSRLRRIAAVLSEAA